MEKELINKEDLLKGLKAGLGTVALVSLALGARAYTIDKSNKKSVDKDDVKKSLYYSDSMYEYKVADKYYVTININEDCSLICVDVFDFTIDKASDGKSILNIYSSDGTTPDSSAMYIEFISEFEADNLIQIFQDQYGFNYTYRIVYHDKDHIDQKTRNL